MVISSSIGLLFSIASTDQHLPFFSCLPALVLIVPFLANRIEILRAFLLSSMEKFRKEIGNAINMQAERERPMGMDQDNNCRAL